MQDLPQIARTASLPSLPELLELRTALVIAHPGHECRVMGWVEQARPHVSLLTVELSRYDAADAEAVSQSIRHSTSLEMVAAGLSELYETVSMENHQGPTRGEDDLRAPAEHLHWLSCHQRALAGELASRHSFLGTLSRLVRSARRRRALRRLAASPDVDRLPTPPADAPIAA